MLGTTKNVLNSGQMDLSGLNPGFVFPKDNSLTNMLTMQTATTTPVPNTSEITTPSPVYFDLVNGKTSDLVVGTYQQWSSQVDQANYTITVTNNPANTGNPATCIQTLVGGWFKLSASVVYDGPGGVSTQSAGMAFLLLPPGTDATFAPPYYNGWVLESEPGAQGGCTSSSDLIYIPADYRCYVGMSTSFATTARCTSGPGLHMVSFWSITRLTS